MATQNLTVGWNSPEVDADHGTPKTYILQAREGETGPFTPLAAGIPHQPNDPQTNVIDKATLDAKVPGLTTGDTLQLQVAGVNDYGTGPWSGTCTTQVPADAAISTDKTTLDVGGDDAERSLTVTGSGFPASAGGMVTLNDGDPGTGGNVWASTRFTTGTDGGFSAELEVGIGQRGGRFHLVATVGDVTVDNTLIIVIGAAPNAELHIDKTTVHSATTDVPTRTVTVIGTQFVPDATGEVMLREGQPGDDDSTAIAHENASTDEYGHFGPVQLIVPEHQHDGAYHVHTKGAIGYVDDQPVLISGATFTDIFVNPNRVDALATTPGRTVYVSGQNLTGTSKQYTVELRTGRVRTDGNRLLGFDVDLDDNYGFEPVEMVVPDGLHAGDYHVHGYRLGQSAHDKPLTVDHGPALILDANRIDSTGTEPQRTLLVLGPHFVPGKNGLVQIRTGAPGTDGDLLVQTTVQTNADGEIHPIAALVVPENTAGGYYHVVTAGPVGTSDSTPLLITKGAAHAELHPNQTAVNSASSDTLTRTIWVDGEGFVPNATGRLLLSVGFPGDTSGALVSETEFSTDQWGLAYPVARIVIAQGQAAGTYHLHTDGDIGHLDETRIMIDDTPRPGMYVNPRTVDSRQAEPARTVQITAERVDEFFTTQIDLRTGPPGSGGDLVQRITPQTDAHGTLPPTPLVIPADQAAGDYHLNGYFGNVTFDNQPFRINNGPTITTDKTTIDSFAPEPSDRTVLITAQHFRRNSDGQLEIRTGAPGTGGDLLVAVPVETDETGQMSGRNPLVVPLNTRSGTYHVLTSGTMGVADNNPLTIKEGDGKATLQIHPESMSRSADPIWFTVTLAGFSPSTDLAIRLKKSLDDTGPEVKKLSGQTWSTGGFHISWQFALRAAAGRYFWKATDARGISSASVPFTITE